MSTETTPSPAPELPPRPSAEEVDQAIASPAGTPRTRILRAEVLHLRRDLEQERIHVSAEAKRAQEFADKLATVTRERDELRETTGSMITPLAYDGVVKQRDDARAERDRLAGELAELKGKQTVAIAAATLGLDDDPTEGGKYYLLQPGDVRVVGLECWQLDGSGWWKVPEIAGPLVSRFRYRAPVTSPQPHWDDAKRRAMLAKREPAEGTLRDEFDAHVKGVLARLERLEQAPARPQVTAWELWCVALELHRSDDEAQPVAHYYDRAYGLIGSAAAFLAEKGVEK